MADPAPVPVKGWTIQKIIEWFQAERSATELAQGLEAFWPTFKAGLQAIDVGQTITPRSVTID